MKKAVIYTRTATKCDMEIYQQIAMCEHYANEKGVAVQKVFIDNGNSGRNTNRPALRKLLRNAKRGKFQFVIIYKMDRLSRNLTDYLMIEKQLAEHDVKIISPMGGA